MKRRQFLKAASVVAATPALYGFHWPFAGEAARDTLLIAGSDTMTNLTKVLTSSFTKIQPRLDISVEGGGSSLGLRALMRGAIDVATMSRDLSDPEDITWLRTFTVARDGLAIVVNKNNPLDDLKLSALADLFLGKITNWKDVGGPDLPVLIITAPKTTPRYYNLHDLVIDGYDTPKSARMANTAADTIKEVTSNPGAIGFLRLKDIDPELKVLKVNGVTMSKATILSGSYRLTRTFYVTLYREDNDKAQSFVDYVTGSAGQKVIEEQGYIPVR